MNRCVLVIRHAEAEEPVDARIQGRDDYHRELTKDGRRKLREGAQGLKRLVEHIDHLVSSPLTRAIQTAELIAEAYPAAKRQQYAGLANGVDHSELLRWVARHDGVIALVGHEPDLSQWIGYAVTGAARSVVLMKKGSVCRLDMPQAAIAGEAQIAWHMSLKQLRYTAESA